MGDKDDTCTWCQGRGYLRCACWPGDCICGEGDETCYECNGDGFIDDDCMYDDDFESKEAGE